MKQLAVKIIKTAILGLGGILMLMPVVWMVSTAFKFEADVFAFPIQWIPERATLNNFTKVFEQFPYWNWYLNTFRNTLLIVTFGLLFASMSGFAFAKINFKGKNIIFLIYISGMMIPGELRLIPQFFMYRNLGIMNTMWAVILPWIFFVGFSIFFMRQAFMAIPDELIEAAKIDGCSLFGIYSKICVPLVKSSFIALGILTFTWGWNDYTGPMIYISDINKQVLSVGIASFKAQYSANYALQMAGATLALVPIILVYLIAQKYLIEGVASSGIKG
ncbi:carbohydrate ABC transporter permease [Candidatus Epulonipiscium viviparus]|uniref:carbohydrate ABC transporter permease n=1 Tax=Candidatus Epulonipiscium viviparus TaxID=420336 RepID=UPI00273806C5|nr:carbohydrate ABC transporter permease [Candidatus Epulopiscium viviparus]